MKNAKDTSRKWMWWFLAVGVALQMYFVKELLAAFALFAAGFAVIAVLVGSVYMMQKAWEVGIARLAGSQNAVVLASRRIAAAMEELGRRPFRRPV